MQQPELSPIECRIISVLVEKELTTPASYPLTLNALVAGCNQKSNRHPVSSYGSDEIDQALSLLTVKGWVANTDVGGRMLKWTHRLGARLELEPGQVAVMAELMMRGAQQPGELRSRVDRMHRIPDQAGLKDMLAILMRRDPALVVRISPRSGERAERYRHTLAPVEEAAPQETERVSSPGIALPDAGVMERLALLETEVAELRTALGELGWSGTAPDPE